MNKERTQKLDKMLDKVKIHTLLKGSVFTTTIGFNLKFSWDEKIPTAGTNGISLRINPNFFESLSKEERIFLYLHEIYHVAFMHIIRGRNKNREKYNIAGDHCINLMLKEGSYKMPAKGLADPQYRGMSTDQIYDLLPDPVEGEGGDGFGMDIDYTDEEGKEMSPQQQKQLETEVENLVLKAITASKLSGERAGTIPASILADIDSLINPVLDWRILLMNFVSDHAKNDFSWKRPNRRLLDIAYLPSLYSESLNHISLAIDLSCSVSKEQYVAFLSEAQYIQEVLEPDKMSIVTFNTGIIDEFEIEKGDSILDLPFNVGGGTDITSTIKHYNKINPTVVIVFSDMEMDQPAEQPKFPIIWIQVNESNYAMKPEKGLVVQYPNKI